MTSAKQMRAFFTDLEILFLVTHIIFHHGINLTFFRYKLPALILGTVRSNLFCATGMREVPWPWSEAQYKVSASQHSLFGCFFHGCLTWNMQPHGKAQPLQGTFSPFSQTQDIWADLGEVFWENKDLKCFYLQRLIHRDSTCFSSFTEPLPSSPLSLRRMPRGSESFYFIKIEIMAF